MLILKFYFLWKAHGIEQIPFTRVFPSGTHLSVESTDAKRIKCLAQEYIHSDAAGVRTIDRCMQKPTSYQHDQYARLKQQECY